MVVDILETDKKYGVIYADPPWTFKTYSAKGKEKKSAEAHYRCMRKEDIQALPVQCIAAEDCVLFLWVTMPCLEEGLELIRKWGFTYKTCAFTWVKQNRKSDGLFWGLGFWTRANAELCLLATRGQTETREQGRAQRCAEPRAGAQQEAGRGERPDRGTDGRYTPHRAVCPPTGGRLGLLG